MEEKEGRRKESMYYLY